MAGCLSQENTTTSVLPYLAAEMGVLLERHCQLAGSSDPCKICCNGMQRSFFDL